MSPRQTASLPIQFESDLLRLRAQLKSHIAAIPTPSAISNESESEIIAPDAHGTWRDIDHCVTPRSVWPARRHLERARTLAVSGRRDEACTALEWWLTRDPLNPNWWHNQIGTPRLVGEILILIDAAPSSEIVGKSRGVFARTGDCVIHEDGTRQPMKWTGANLIWLSINRLLAAALRGDEEGIRFAVDAAMSEVRLAGPGEEGIQPDYAFHQHGPLLYNGGYGEAFLGDACYFIAATHGTRWEPSMEKRALLADYLLEGTRWMLRGHDVNPGCRDREITRPRATAASYARAAAVLQNSCPTRADELRDLGDSIREFRAPGAARGNRYFASSDFMVHHTSDAGYSVRMHSSRTLRGECCNDEGILSHHLADGLTYLTRTGDEYRDVYPVWDWQKLPGTTVAQTACDEPRQLVRQRGGSDAVGGVSDGEFGVCAQHLFHNSLTARKSWFFGPDSALVCLGADIHSGHDSVVTTLDQSPVQGVVEHDGTTLALAAGHDATLTGASWLRHGPWLYVFPSPTDVKIELGPRNGAWSRIGSGPSDRVTRDVFLAFIEHGPGASGANYAYSVHPLTENRTTCESTASAPPYLILENSARVHAVWWHATGLLQCVFWQSGKVALPDGRTIRSEGESIIQLRRNGIAGWIARATDLRQRGEAAGFAMLDADGNREPINRQ